MDFLSYMASHFESVVNAIIDKLPKSPISYLVRNETAAKYLGYVNWFIPVYSWISILETWLIAIAVYYVVQVLLRWFKVVE